MPNEKVIKVGGKYSISGGIVRTGWREETQKYNPDIMFTLKPAREKGVEDLGVVEAAVDSLLEELELKLMLLKFEERRKEREPKIDDDYGLRGYDEEDYEETPHEVWVYHTMLDDAVCPICRPLHGEIYYDDARVFDTFPYAEYYEDMIIPNTHAPRDYNCRCVILAEVKNW